MAERERPLHESHAALLAVQTRKWDERRARWEEEARALLAQQRRKCESHWADYYERVRGLLAQLGPGLEESLVHDEFVRVESAREALYGDALLENVAAKFAEQSRIAQLAQLLPRVQAVIRRYNAMMSFQALTLEADLRKRVLREMATSEATYVQGLEKAIEAYGEPLRGLIDPRDHKTIFGGLQLVLPVSRALANALEKRFAVQQAVTVWAVRISDVLDEHIKLIKGVYVQYVSQYDQVLSTLKRIAAMSKIRAVTKDLQGKGALALDSYLIMPVQRVPRYQLLLQELLRHTPVETPDGPALQKTYERIVDVAQAVDAARERDAAAQRILAIQRELGSTKCPDLLQPHRKYIGEGHFLMRAPESAILPTFSLPLLHVWIVLFNDSLLICSKRSPARFDWGAFVESRTLDFLTLLPLYGVLVHACDVSQGWGWMLWGRHMEDSTPYTFLIDPEHRGNKDDKEVIHYWLENVRECAARLREDRKSRDLRSPEDSDSEEESIAAGKIVPVPLTLLKRASVKAAAAYRAVHCEWLHASDSIPPRTLLPIAEQCEQLSSQLASWLRFETQSPSTHGLGSSDLSSSLRAAVGEGRALMDQLRLLISSEFPSSNTDASRNIRRAMAALLKWHLALEDLVADTSVEPTTETATSNRIGLQ